MITVLRGGSLRVVIYKNDHGPPHVHVFGDGECKIALSPAVRLDGQEGATKVEARRAMTLVFENRDLLLRRWNEIHG
ncbi:DUF4160 domain-containing protein [Mesorhizobium sp. LHD-90]|uniref:DUF4160 domain-containing protein n=1 Tax=Mesorhizobium sp. LHD-90 TaxID=3071414 RepID=UPI0027DEC979|nr:DUF4160 domain-containing protein [Mesorhizobium sp. LHD-90]MDQ6434748.1 DUF4160 domain-containing protein [Mesorhizobium sp. LHD-90]